MLVGLCIIREHSELRWCVPHWALTASGQSHIFCEDSFCPKREENMDDSEKHVLLGQLLFGYFLLLVSSCFVFLFVGVMTHECQAGSELMTWWLISQLSHQGTCVYPCLGDS